MGCPPLMNGYKPFGIPIKELGCVRLLFEEYEAIKLADYNMLTQEEAAKKMNVSRPTFTRIYEQARQTIAKAFVEGKAIIVDGGDVAFSELWYKCETCNEVFSSEDQLDNCSSCGSEHIHLVNDKQTGEPITEEKKICTCLSCNTRIEGKRKQKCQQAECPKCGMLMVRENSYQHAEYIRNVKSMGNK